MTRISRLLVTFVASGGFVGFIPLLPGTAGSLLGLLVIRIAALSRWRLPSFEFLMLFVVAFIVSCGVAGSAEKIFAEPDCSAIVLDEILGMIATMLGNPTSWRWLIAGFMLFRLFDIIKPWPASWFDRLHGGTGVMLDDLAAACYANITLRVLWRISRT